MIKNFLLALAFLLCVGCGGSGRAVVRYNNADLYITNYSRCAYDTVDVGPFRTYVDMFPGETWYVGSYSEGYYDVRLYDSYTGCTYYIFDVGVFGTTTLEVY